MIPSARVTFGSVGSSTVRIAMSRMSDGNASSVSVRIEITLSAQPPR